MDDLPREARALLDMARDGHDPVDPEARQRVRKGVYAALLTTGAGASVGATGKAAALTSGKTVAKLGGLWGLGPKTVLLGAVVLASAGGIAGLVVGPLGSESHGSGVRASQAVTAMPADAPHWGTDRAGDARDDEPAPTPSAAPIQVAPVELAAPSPLTATRSKVKTPFAVHRRARKPEGTSLAEETRLLDAAAHALASKDLGAAATALAEHRARFRTPVLREERDGLTAVQLCMSSASDEHTRIAKRFLQRYPASVLAVRVSRACGLKP